MPVLQKCITDRPGLQRPLAFSPRMQEIITVAGQNSLFSAARTISFDVLFHSLAYGRRRAMPEGCRKHNLKAAAWFALSTHLTWLGLESAMRRFTIIKMSHPSGWELFSSSTSQAPYEAAPKSERMQNRSWPTFPSIVEAILLRKGSGFNLKFENYMVNQNEN